MGTASPIAIKQFALNEKPFGGKKGISANQRLSDFTEISSAQVGRFETNLRPHPTPTHTLMKCK